MNKSTTEIRQTFLDFFKSKKHKIVKSSSLIPDEDPTLLFTNAGMNQFKNIFLGYEKYNDSRVATAQRCVRAGGKHNDLDNVGYTNRHHTFFEMLGNFSFGDYFKELAISYAWELLTSNEWFNLPKKRLWITVYKNDEETYNIWKNKINIDPGHIIRIGDKNGKIYESDNFWQMGDIGPCGPCTEIFYDYGDHIQGDIPGSKCNGERYIEIWNIVFMQFDRQYDNTMNLLPRPSVDTGMGLERMASVLQNVNSNYEIDLFQKLILKISNIINVNSLNNKSLYVIADHIRSCSFLIADGIIPSNEKRGYVLRRIIRRAIRHGYKLGIKNIFFYKLVEPLIEVMSGEDSNILKYKKNYIEDFLRIEEEQFNKTLKRGLNILNNKLALLKTNTLDGNTIFNLYDTFGFPVDLTMDICRENNIKFDKNGFDIAISKQRNKSKKSQYILKSNNCLLLSETQSIFKGYDILNIKAKVKALFMDGKEVTQLFKNQNGIVILNQTSFYSESGGQIGDIGKLEGENSIFNVINTEKHGKIIYHIGTLEFGCLKVNDILYANVNKAHRYKVCCNHSAIHLLHYALRKILGKNVLQKGSFINDKYLRFDFSHKQALTQKEIDNIENIVNNKIRENLLISIDYLSLEDAKKKGAIALFDEKYNTNQVRMISIGNDSIELCCGTHVKYTGNIGFFNILFESGIASGIRRIEALTGENAVLKIQKQKNYLRIATTALKVNNLSDLNKKINEILNYVNSLEKKINEINYQKVIQDSTLLINNAIQIKDIKLLINHFNYAEIKTLRNMIDYLKNKLGSAIIIFSTIIKNKISLIIGVTNNLTNCIQANALVSEILIQQNIDSKYGGRPDMAIAGGIKEELLKNILDKIKKLVISKL